MLDQEWRLNEYICPYDWISPNHFDRALLQLEQLVSDGSVDYETVLLPRLKVSQTGYREMKTDLKKAGIMSYYISRELLKRTSHDELIDALESETSIDEIEYICDSVDQPEHIENWSHYVFQIGLYATEAEVPKEYETLFTETAELIEKAIESGEFKISDLRGKVVDREDQSLLMTYPTEMIVDFIDESNVPDDIIIRDTLWTTPEMDYWDCSFALLAVANGIIEPSQVQTYQEPRNISEVMQGTGQKPWLSYLDDRDVLDLSIQARSYGATGKPPYRALKYIAKKKGYEMNDGVLTRSSRLKSERIFEDLCD